MSKFIIRDVVSYDKNYIMQSWLRTAYNQSDWSRPNKPIYIPVDTFYSGYDRLVHAWLAHPGVMIKVATLPDALDVILGYAVYTRDCIHWVNVKASWRKLGIAKALLPNMIQFKYCSNLSLAGRSLKERFNLIYNPFYTGEK